MSIVRVKNKYQVVIPERVRADVGVHIGDTFEVKAERGKITFTPKSIVVVDRELALGLDDVRKGRLSPHFDTVDEMLTSLRGGKKVHHRQAPRSR